MKNKEKDLGNTNYIFPGEGFSEKQIKTDYIYPGMRDFTYDKKTLPKIINETDYVFPGMNYLDKHKNFKNDYSGYSSPGENKNEEQPNSTDYVYPGEEE